MIEINKYKLVPGITPNWGDILGDITKQQDLVDYVAEHGGGVAEWGSITGDIGDQEDLATLLEQYAMKEWVQDQGYLVQSDLSQYATRQWVTGRGYITSDALNGYATEQWVGEQGYIDQIKTVNNQSLVGTGNIEVSGLTPEQEDAIDPLMNTSGGVLYTEELLSKKQTWKNITFMYNDNIHQIKDDVYMFQSGSLYRFDTEILDFVKVSSFDSWGNQWLWEDNSGRLYDGYTYQLDIDTGTTISVDTEGYYMTKYYMSSKMNLLYGQYGIWLLSENGLCRFDETTQKFVSGYELKLPDGVASIGDEWYSCLFNYDGHNLLYLNGTTYEFVEYEESINVEDVSGTYFTTPSHSIDPTMIFTLSDGNLYYARSNRRIYKYNKTTGVWSQYAYLSYAIAERMGIVDNLVVGGNSQNSPYKYMITNLGSDIRFSYWTEVNKIAIDLDSAQTIEGQKTFNALQSSYFNVSQMNALGTGTVFNLGNNTTNASKIEISSPLVMLNSNPVATTDQLIINREKLPYGGYKRNVTNQYGFSLYAQSYFMTHTGRLFGWNDDDGYRYEFNGSSFVNPTSPQVRVYNDNGGKVIVAPNQTFYYYGDYVYLWDDTNSDFVQICNTSVSNNAWSNWWDGTNLRNGETKLVNNGGTWEWVSDPINKYKSGMYHYVNSTVYCLCIDDMIVYEYDPINKTYEALGYWNQWTSECSFVAGGDILFPYNGDKWMKIDFSKIIPGRDNYITSDTAIPYDDMGYVAMHYEFNGELLYSTADNIWACWGMEEEFPDVPATNGTYVLQATRVGDTITYEWVSNQI